MLDYGPEGSIPLSWGGQLRFESYINAFFPTYVRIVDKDGIELVYWSIDEFADDPQLVLGALLGCMQNGPG